MDCHRAATRILPASYVSCCRNIITPDLPVEPEKALTLIRSIIDELQKEETLVIGTSMGAMYARQLNGHHRILVNPAFHVSELLRKNEVECKFQ